MSSGGGGSQQKSTQTVVPWAGVQPYITDYLAKSQNVANTPFQYNAGDQIAPFSPEQQYGLAAQTQRAIQGSPVNAAAQSNITDTLNGNYLSPDSNPWLKANVDQALNDVTGRINSQFGNANFGGSANQELLARNLGSTAAGLYGQNYTTERGNQLQAANLAPTLANTDYQDIAALQNVGAQRQGLSQSYLNQANNLYNSYIGYPAQQLDIYGNAVRTGLGGGSTSTSSTPNPNQSNPFAGALGGAATGFSIGGPWGAAAGGLLGALSDQRLKTNIKRIGTHKKGFGIYEYDILGRHEVGVLAQEVEKVIPEAVTLHPSGYKQVYYAMLG